MRQEALISTLKQQKYLKSSFLAIKISITSRQGEGESVQGSAFFHDRMG
jgi:hypothetical protein